MKCRMQINIKGIVQGVGFMPFIYNLAKRYNLAGYVLNDTTGVSIEVEGEREAIKEFVRHVKSTPPPQAEIFESQSQHTQREHGDKTEIVFEPLIRGVGSDLLDGIGIDSISAKFHNTIAHIVLNICLRVRNLKGIDAVVLSGGVFQNTFLLDRTFALLNENGFRLYTHHRVPPNDGGIALGQAIIANEWIKKGKI